MTFLATRSCYPTPAIPSTLVAPVEVKEVTEFFDFIFKRQQMWYDRFVDKKPAPWTDDPILDRWKFTNVSRYLDRGTIYFLDYLKRENPDPIDLVWNSLLYRMLNNMSCHKETIGFHKHADFNYSDWYTKLRSRGERGERVLCQSHNTCAFTTMPGGDKIERVCLVIANAHTQVSQLVADIEKHRDNPLAVFNAIREVRGYGEFLAYEIWCDLSYTNLTDFTEDDWTNAGPGAQRGLAYLSGDKKKRSAQAMRDAIAELRDLQDFYYGVVLQKDFSKIAVKDGRLSLRDIEHSLCEISKYIKLKNKTGMSFSGTYRSQEHKNLVDLDYEILNHFPKIV